MIRNKSTAVFVWNGNPLDCTMYFKQANSRKESSCGWVAAFDKIIEKVFFTPGILFKLKVSGTSQYCWFQWVQRWQSTIWKNYACIVLDLCRQLPSLLYKDYTIFFTYLLCYRNIVQPPNTMKASFGTSQLLLKVTPLISTLVYRTETSTLVQKHRRSL